MWFAKNGLVKPIITDAVPQRIYKPIDETTTDSTQFITQIQRNNNNSTPRLAKLHQQSQTIQKDDNSSISNNKHNSNSLSRFNKEDSSVFSTSRAKGDENVSATPSKSKLDCIIHNSNSNLNSFNKKQPSLPYLHEGYEKLDNLPNIIIKNQVKFGKSNEIPILHASLTTRSYQESKINNYNNHRSLVLPQDNLNINGQPTLDHINNKRINLSIKTAEDTKGDYLTKLQKQTLISQSARNIHQISNSIQENPLLQDDSRHTLTKRQGLLDLTPNKKSKHFQSTQERRIHTETISTTPSVSAGNHSMYDSRLLKQSSNDNLVLSRYIHFVESQRDKTLMKIIAHEKQIKEKETLPIKDINLNNNNNNDTNNSNKYLSANLSQGKYDILDAENSKKSNDLTILQQLLTPPENSHSSNINKSNRPNKMKPSLTQLSVMNNNSPIHSSVLTDRSQLKDSRDQNQTQVHRQSVSEQQQQQQVSLSNNLTQQDNQNQKESLPNIIPSAHRNSIIQSLNLPIQLSAIPTPSSHVNKFLKQNSVAPSSRNLPRSTIKKNSKNLNSQASATEDNENISHDTSSLPSGIQKNNNIIAEGGGEGNSKASMILGQINNSNEVNQSSQKRESSITEFSNISNTNIRSKQDNESTPSSKFQQQQQLHQQSTIIQGSSSTANASNPPQLIQQYSFGGSKQPLQLKNHRRSSLAQTDEYLLLEKRKTMSKEKFTQLLILLKDMRVAIDQNYHVIKAAEEIADYLVYLWKEQLINSKALIAHFDRVLANKSHFSNILNSPSIPNNHSSQDFSNLIKNSLHAASFLLLHTQKDNFVKEVVIPDMFYFRDQLIDYIKSKRDIQLNNLQESIIQEQNSINNIQLKLFYSQQNKPQNNNQKEIFLRHQLLSEISHSVEPLEYITKAERMLGNFSLVKQSGRLQSRQISDALVHLKEKKGAQMKIFDE